jgi:hypothetical protein
MHLPNIQVRESSLNQAILDLARTDFLFGPFDLQALAPESFRSFYADHVAFWLGPELITGREEALARLAGSLEPIYTLLEMGTMTVESFQVTLTMKDSQEHLVSVWELRLGGPYATGKPLCWQTIRLWRNGVVIAERIANLPELGVRTME